MADRSKRPPSEALVDLRRRLALLLPRDPARSEVIARAAKAYGVSVWTIYRTLPELTRPKSVWRSDQGSTRAAPAATMERYAEILAALKVRTTNKKGPPSHGRPVSPPRLPDVHTCNKFTQTLSNLMTTFPTCLALAMTRKASAASFAGKVE